MEETLKKLESQLDKMYQEKLCYESHLMENNLILNGLNFYAFAGQVLIFQNMV